MADTKTLAEALCAAQSQMKNPKKDKTAKVRTRTGGEYTYSYTTLDDVLDVVRPALNENGLFLSQRSESAGDGMLLRTCVMYGDTVHELDVTPYQYDTDPQEFGKRETYARRYSILKAFALAGVEDTDGDTGAGGMKPPSNPTGHALGNTVKPKATPEQRRKKMLARCADLAAKCIENGMNAGATDAYMIATFNVDAMDELTDEQLEAFGMYLAEMVKQSAELKARREQK